MTRTHLFFASLALLILGTPNSFGQIGKPVQIQAIPSQPFDGNGGVWVPEWTGAVQVSALENLTKMYPAQLCRDCGFDASVVNLPVYTIWVPVGKNEQIQVVSAQPTSMKETLEDGFVQAVRESGIEAKGDFFPAQWAVPGERVTHLGKEMQALHLYPVRVSGDGGTVRRAEGIAYSIQKIPFVNKTSGGPANRTYAPNSILASGDWFKLGVTSSGLFKLDYSYLSSIGVDVASLDPRTLRVHNNGNGMLPQKAGDFPYDDLVETAIYVSGESDGTFDQGDYILFFGQSPHKWKWSESLGSLYHQTNLYSDTTFYFLTYGGTPGKRVQSVASAGGINHTPTSVTQVAFHEEENYNPITSGRVWIGETFDLTTSQTFSFPLNKLAAGSEVDVLARVGARSSVSSNFSVTENGVGLGTMTVPTVDVNVYGTFYYRTAYRSFSLPASSLGDGSLDLNFTYSKPSSSSVGYMDYLDVQFRRSLDLGGNSQLIFFLTDQVGPGQVFGMNFTNGNGAWKFWDVSDPLDIKEVQTSGSGGNFSFGIEADTQKVMLAFNGTTTATPVSGHRVSAQNLHGLSAAEFLIITPALFLSQANQLADFHRNTLGQTVHVVQVDKIYNEFGSGAQDPTAIRDFIKMFYDRHLATNEQPKWVLMLGDGSYDPKHRIASGTVNFVPTYQGRKSQRPTESYTSDDFYGFLDDGEGFWGEKSSQEGGVTDILFLLEGDTLSQTHYLDVAIGRMPVGSVEEAQEMVDKVIQYATNPEGMGPWRNKIVLVADHKDADGTTHISQSDSYSNLIRNANPSYNVDKIFMDNYTMEITASGNLFPTGKDALLNSLEEGSLIVNYTGHGGETGWSNSSILEIPDINNLANGLKLPAYVTATCEFGRWDDPARRSGGELLFLNPQGGAIAMFTTVRVVYSGPNYALNQNFYNYALSWDAALNRMPTLGEIFQRTKNASWSSGSINNRNFTLMGDPALTLNYPKNRAVITQINGDSVLPGQVDSLGALTLVTVNGKVEDPAGNFLSSYNGEVFITVFDKPSKFTTKRSPYTFYWQKNRVFNGKGTVANGVFSFQFVVPIDISYEAGLGKISLYLENPNEDGAGYDGDIYIGGTNGSSIVDNRGPEMDLYMNDEQFVDGGLVNPDADLLAILFDDNGINTVGSGVGHELLAVLDGEDADPIILNDFYEADANSYQRGSIRFPFQDLEVGEHSLRVKVWDVANNSTEGVVNFLVADDANMALQHVLNYPNPFSTHTQFLLEHNQNGKQLDLTIKIYSVSGKVVKVLEDSFFAEGNFYRGLDWDGLDDYGDVIGRGVYVYEVTLRDPESGESAKVFEKLVLLR